MVVYLCVCLNALPRQYRGCGNARQRQARRREAGAVRAPSVAALGAAPAGEHGVGDNLHTSAAHADRDLHVGQWWAAHRCRPAIAARRVPPAAPPCSHSRPSARGHPHHTHSTALPAQPPSVRGRLSRGRVSGSGGVGRYSAAHPGGGGWSRRLPGARPAAAGTDGAVPTQHTHGQTLRQYDTEPKQCR